MIQPHNQTRGRIRHPFHGNPKVCCSYISTKVSRRGMSIKEMYVPQQQTHIPAWVMRQQLLLPSNNVNLRYGLLCLHTASINSQTWDMTTVRNNSFRNKSFLIVIIIILDKNTKLIPCTYTGKSEETTDNQRKSPILINTSCRWGDECSLRSDTCLVACMRHH